MKIFFFSIPIFFLAANPVYSQQVSDSSFNTKVETPAFTRKHPTLAIDDGHNNAFGSNFRMRGFIELFKNDGYKIVIDSSGNFQSETLRTYDLLIIGGAQGTYKQDTIIQAFSEKENDAIYGWVEKGGSLLLLVDHPPFDTSAVRLVQRLGAKVGIGVVWDTVNYFKSGSTGDTYKSWIMFSNENGGLGNHPIIGGRNGKEQVRNILTQGGSSIGGPIGSSAILKFSETAENRKHRTGYGPSRLQPAQMVAFTLGRGRVVISADATFFSSQRVTREGVKFELGMSRLDFDNRQLVINVMHWLSRIL